MKAPKKRRAQRRSKPKPDMTERAFTAALHRQHIIGPVEYYDVGGGTLVRAEGSTRRAQLFNLLSEKVDAVRNAAIEIERREADREARDAGIHCVAAVRRVLDVMGFGGCASDRVDDVARSIGRALIERNRDGSVSR